MNASDFLDAYGSLLCEDACPPAITNQAVGVALGIDTDTAIPLLKGMIKNDYGGCTFKWYQKYPPAIALAAHGRKGIAALADVFLESDRFSTQSVAGKTMLALASGTADTQLSFYVPQDHPLRSLDLADESIRIGARSQLARLALDANPEQPVPEDVIQLFSQASLGASVHNEPDPITVLFEALLPRWFRINDSGISEFETVISLATSEQEVHRHLQSHPHLIDPMVLRAWSKPRLGERLQPDFLLQSVDNSYLVVEIERPDDTIVTAGNEISAKTTHAIRQALEYQDWIIKNHLYARTVFPNIDYPKALVVIGIESALNQEQRSRLDLENRSRAGGVEIVGFDRLATRAKALLDNLLLRTGCAGAIVIEEPERAED